MIRSASLLSSRSGCARPVTSDQPVRRFHESPSLRLAWPYSVSFVFVSRLTGREGHGVAVRLERLRDRLKHDNEVYEKLIERPSSYFRDIVNLAFESSLPLVTLVEPEINAATERSITMLRPALVTYVAEGVQTELHRLRSDDERTAFGFRDSFALFESGHLMYVLSLFPAGENEPPRDEYLLVQLEKLARPTEGCEELRQHIRWVGPGSQGAVPLTGFIAARLASLARAPRTEASPNAVRDVLVPHVWHRRRFELEPESVPFGWEQLKSVVIGIENEKLYLATRALLGSKSEGDGDNETTGQAISRLLMANAPAPCPIDRSLSPHVPAERTPAERLTLAVSGIVNGVIDFPFQDPAEVADSVQPFQEGNGFIMFQHPPVVVELATEWRSLRKELWSLGCCPYQLLSNLVLTYNETILVEANRHLEVLQYSSERKRADDPVLARPLGHLAEILERFRVHRFRGPLWYLRQHIRTRIDVFRDLLLRYIPNVFQYPAERTTYERVSELRGLGLRYERLREVLAGYETIVRDLFDVERTMAERRINWLLVVLAVLGLISVLADLPELIDNFPRLRKMLWP